MSSFSNSSIQRQRGISIIEAIISMLIISVTCAGSLYIVTRANEAKTEMSLQEIAIHQMRQRLINHGAGVDACTPFNLQLPGVAAGNQPQVNPISGCGVPAAAEEVTVDAKPVAGMPGRIVLAAQGGPLAGQIVVGGS